MTTRSPGGHSYRVSTAGSDPADPSDSPLSVVPVDSGPSSAPPTLETIHAEHFPFIYRSLRGLGVPPSLLDDAAQEVLFVVHRRIGEFAPGTALRPWLFAIATRVASNYRRSTRRRAVREASGSVMPRPAPDPDAQLAGREAVELTERFMEELDEGQRAVFVLALIEGLPAGEVAVALGVPTNTVYSRIRLVRQKFRELLALQYQETLR